MTPSGGADTWIAKLARVTGDWPPAAAGRPIVFAGCCADYLARHGYPFARSLDRNAPGAHLHLHVVNPGADTPDIAAALAGELRHTSLSRTEERVDLSGLPRDFQRAYHAGIRFVRLLQLLRARRADVLLLDIDVVIRDRLDELRALAAGHDCAVRTRFRRRKDREKFFASTLYATPSPACLAFLEDAARRIAIEMERRTAGWFVDQVALAQAWRAARDGARPLRIRHLPERFADWEFRKTSAIWAGKGKRKDSDETYLAECAVYTPRQVRLKSAALAASAASGRAAIVLPRLDLPFENPGGLRGLPDRIRRRRPQDAKLRTYWRSFAEGLRDAFEHAGRAAEVIEMPLWRVTPTVLDGLEADIVFVPHRQRFQLGPLRCRTLFYAQGVFPWLFTVDPLGWGAGSSAYPCDDGSGDPQRGTFERYVELVVRDNRSKYDQGPATDRRHLIARGEIPDGPYIFFPCQRPTDRAIRLFSPHDPVDVGVAVARWARRRGLGVVFKAHPTNAASAEPLRRAAAGDGVFWSTAGIHDLIPHSAAVYTINSGVGLEAMLHDRPIVTFGRAEYDAATIRGDPRDLDGAWRAVSASHPGRRKDRYRRFVDWYCRRHCIDVNEPQAVLDRCNLEL